MRYNIQREGHSQEQSKMNCLRTLMLMDIEGLIYKKSYIVSGKIKSVTPAGSIGSGGLRHISGGKGFGHWD